MRLTLALFTTLLCAAAPAPDSRIKSAGLDYAAAHTYESLRGPGFALYVDGSDASMRHEAELFGGPALDAAEARCDYRENGAARATPGYYRCLRAEHFPRVADFYLRQSGR